MKRLALVLAIGAVIFSSLLNAAPARAALSFEDPQLCVNGKLLMIEPTTAGIEVWVRVGPDLVVDFDVTHCGGDPSLPVIAPDHVSHNGKTKWLEAAVLTKKHTDVVFDWNGNTTTKNSGSDFWVYAKTKVN